MLPSQACFWLIVILQWNTALAAACLESEGGGDVTDGDIPAPQ